MCLPHTVLFLTLPFPLLLLRQATLGSDDASEEARAVRSPTVKPLTAPSSSNGELDSALQLLGVTTASPCLAARGVRRN